MSITDGFRQLRKGKVYDPSVVPEPKRRTRARSQPPPAATSSRGSPSTERTSSTQATNPEVSPAHTPIPSSSTAGPVLYTAEQVWSIVAAFRDLDVEYVETLLSLERVQRETEAIVHQLNATADEHHRRDLIAAFASLPFAVDSSPTSSVTPSSVSSLPPTPSEMANVPLLPGMPTPTDPKAPRFEDPNAPLALSRYLDTLDRLFTQAGVNTDEDKRSYALSYVPGHMALYWATFAGYSTMTWDAFKEALKAAYPEATMERKYLHADLDRLQEEFVKRGVDTLSQYQEFWQRFSIITTNMAANSQVSKYDKAKTWQNVMCNSRHWQQMRGRIDHLSLEGQRGDPISLDKLHDMALRVLSGDLDQIPSGQAAPTHTAAPPMPYYPPSMYPQPPVAYAPQAIAYPPFQLPASTAMVPAAPAQPLIPATAPPVKLEDMKHTIEVMMKETIGSVVAELRQEIAAIRGGEPNTQRRNNNGQCHYCGEFSTLR